MNRLGARLDETDGRTALVRGASAPVRFRAVVRIEPGICATFAGGRMRAPLSVSAVTAEGETICRYRDTNAATAVERAATLVEECDPRGVWLCGRDRISSWWGEPTARGMARRLEAVAESADARLVVWTSEERAVASRYDVVLDP